MQNEIVSAATESSSLFSTGEWIAFGALLVAFSGLFVAFAGLWISLRDGRRARREAKDREETLRLNLLSAISEELKLNVWHYSNSYKKAGDYLEHARQISSVPLQVEATTIYYSNGAEIPKLGSKITGNIILAYGQLETGANMVREQMNIYVKANTLETVEQRDDAKAVFKVGCKLAAIACAQAIVPIYNEIGKEIQPFVKEVLAWSDDYKKTDT